MVSDQARKKITLSKKGVEYSGLCPFHSEKTPSFTINDKKRFYHCFGCGAHGDVIKFESELSGMSYKDSAYKIAGEYGVEIPRFSKEEERQQLESDRIATILKLATDYYISNVNSEIIAILNKRGISADTISKYNIGYTGNAGGLLNYFKEKNFRLEEIESTGLISKKAHGRYSEFFHNRITIPIYTVFGKIIGFGGRSLGSELPKYINSPETLVFKKGESLFGEDVAYSSAHKKGYVLLVEGYFDVISLNQAGFPNVVASLGTAVTPAQLGKLWKIADEIIVCLDGDDAGLRANNKIVEIATQMISGNKKLSFVIMPQGYDPDDLVIKHGRQYFNQLIDERKSFSEYVFLSISKNHKTSTAEEKSEFEAKLKELSNKILDQTLKKNMNDYFYNESKKLYNNKSYDNIRTDQKPTLRNSNELASVDDVIVGYLLTNISNITKEMAENIINIVYNDSNRKELLNYILENAFNENNNYESDFIHKIKKTSFFEEFEILSAACKNSIPTYSTVLDLEEVVDYLKSKRYLITLTNEFKQITNSNEFNEDKLKYYMLEIQNMKNKINFFNSKIALVER